MHSVWQDVRIAVRGYLKKPLFTLVVLAILGLGIGANSAIFSIVNGVLLRPLDYPRAGELVSARQINRDTGRRRSISPPDYFDLKDRTRAFSGVAAYWSPSISISGAGGDPEKVLAATCSFDLFAVLGVAPGAGRGFIADDDVAGARRVAVLGHGLWQRRFGGDPSAIGRELILDGVPTLIVGVMPDGFAFPVAGTELWVPLRLSRTQPPNPAIRPEHYRSYRILNVVARLRPGVTVEQSQSELGAIGDQLERAYPDANRRSTFAVTPLQDTVVAPIRPALLLLLAAVGCVLLIACANVGSLLLVRAAGRAREMAIRMALGAGRGRLVRQMLVESVVLAIAGGAVGLVVGAWTLDLLLRLAPAGIPRLDGVRMDATVIGFTFGIAVLAGVIFGIAPALQIRAHRLHEALLASGRGLVAASNQRVRQLLVVGEIALSLMLLIGAVLLIQSFARVQRVDTGFRASSVLTVERIELPLARSSPEASAAFFDGLEGRLRAIPGVESAGVTLGLPLDPRARFFVDESTFTFSSGAGAPPIPPSQRPQAPVHVVSPDYFATIGAPLVRGRWFTERDRATAPGVVIINDAMARQFWPGENPIGRRITHDLSIVPGQQTTREIVGVVGDVRHFGIERPAEPQMFVPHAQMPWPSMAVVIRSPLDASHLTAAVRQAVWSVDATIPVPPLRPMDQALADAVGQPRLRAWLLGLFAATAILLAMTGLYGTMAYAAQQRTREIGLRIALGATPRQATGLLLGSGLRLAAIGIGAGLAGSIGVARALSTMLFGVRASDPATFIAVPVMLGLVAAVACYLPARRARRIDPIAAINADV
jgi:putative ABC transport system permease protein